MTKIYKLQNNAVSHYESISKFLNSNLFIWFLSSVILSGGASLYHFSQQHYDQSQTMNKEIANCQFEIVNRLNHMIHLVNRSKTIADAQFALSSMNKSLGSVVPEFEHVNMAALYFKQYQLKGIQDSQNNQDFRELEELHLTMLTSDPKSNLSESDKKKILALLHNLKNYESSLINKKS